MQSPNGRDPGRIYSLPYLMLGSVGLVCSGRCFDSPLGGKLFFNAANVFRFGDL
jgi:hypothetical protein